MKPTYFTCTLGQAAALELTDKSFQNINKFIESRAHISPDDPAVGFAIPSTSDKEPWGSSIWTFSEILQGSRTLAYILDEEHRDGLRRAQAVALICPSTPEFLFVWLALMRLGHAVLLIAPQCQPAAIAHLCKECNAEFIFYDAVYTDQTQEASELSLKNGFPLRPTLLPFAPERSLVTLLDQRLPEPKDLPCPAAKDTAYLHHTSGTSSGVPKPIAQSHSAGAGVLPALPDGRDAATFTTTPLYHGGIADLFRAWSSGALIWLFPGKGVPITASNIVRCLDAGTADSGTRPLPPIRYFSSVPYVLQLMEADKLGLRYLQGMHIVGVGGAALPTEVGNRIVKQGINLISRFGSAECGFIMSSHRNYEDDEDWQYLRSSGGSDLLKFEEREGGLAELVIASGWPHMAKSNRSDGSYATADLFEAHSKSPNAWRYDSRADSQLTLITGKKFDPAPLEGEIASSELLDDVLIFGNARPFPGALLFRSEAAHHMTDAEVKEQIWQTVDRLNGGSQDHARMAQNMLVVMPVLDTALQKSSKGTIIRGAAESRFSSAIDDAYSDMSSFGSDGEVLDKDVVQWIKDMIMSVVPKKAQLDDDTDLFSYGVDSVAGMQIRFGLRRLLPGSPTIQLPLNIVEDCGTAARLAEYVIRQRSGDEILDDDDEEALMLALVEQYSEFEQRPRPTGEGGDYTQRQVDNNGRDEHGKDVIVLTGATGALGAHVLALYRQSTSVAKIICLVRGGDESTSRQRLNEGLLQRGLPELSPRDPKVEVLSASLGVHHLGLSDEDYNRITAEVTVVVHVAWSVNFRMRLRSFVKDNISGVTNLINLALNATGTSPAKFAYCSSIASALAYRGEKPLIPEEIIDDPAVSSRLGYSRSKWVAEQICGRAGQETALRGRIGVFRIGQLAGDSDRGVWNTKEAWPIMLSSVKLTRTLPALEEQTLDWLPVDVAAMALTQAVNGVGGSGEIVDVVHVLNDKRTPLWTDLLGWLSKETTFDTVSPAEWVARLEAAQDQDGADHPAFKLLDLWKRAYSDKHPSPQNKEQREELPQGKSPDMLKTKKMVPSLRDIKPLDEAYMIKVWRWIDRHM